MQVIKIDDKKYPALLKNIPNPPKVLYVEGNVELLSKDLVAIIGSRDYTEYGEKQAKRFAKELSDLEIGIVSGMAIGIDTFAHIETIRNGGKTVAVLGFGFDNIYPKENKELFDLIIKTGGTVISEYPPEVRMQKRNFPLRNRIVSGLTLGTLVIEATHRSGTSITAKYAWKQGRKVFCIPNSIDNKNSCGTINLLKTGAKLVTNSREIISEFGKLNHKIKKREILENKDINEVTQKIDLDQYDKQTKTIIKLIQQKEEISSNLISEILEIPIQKVNSILTVLEMDEIIENIGGCKYKIYNNNGEINV